MLWTQTSDSCWVSYWDRGVLLLAGLDHAFSGFGTTFQTLTG